MAANLSPVTFYAIVESTKSPLRSRPYHKNDQAHVEQKNWSVVRHTIGYDRLETPEELALLCAIYTDLRLYINFFQPVLKLVGKEQVDGKTVKKYDRAATHLSPGFGFRICVSLEVKARLTSLYVQASCSFADPY